MGRIPIRRDERGMATAEYAVGTLGAACIACVLIQLGAHESGWLRDIIDRISDVGLFIGPRATS